MSVCYNHKISRIVSKKNKRVIFIKRNASLFVMDGHDYQPCHVNEKDTR
jgi:hypothetical protein